jgi:hypothetical protein
VLRLGIAQNEVQEKDAAEWNDCQRPLLSRERRGRVRERIAHREYRDAPRCHRHQEQGK